MCFFMAEFEGNALVSKQNLYGAVCEESCRLLASQVRWESLNKGFVSQYSESCLILLEISMCLHYLSHHLTLYQNNKCHASRLLCVICRLPEANTLPSQCQTALILLLSSLHSAVHKLVFVYCAKKSAQVSWSCVCALTGRVAAVGFVALRDAVSEHGGLMVGFHYLRGLPAVMVLWFCDLLSSDWQMSLGSGIGEALLPCLHL